ncbi:MAG: c-type cytochrome [Bryobacteraceae bacterium]
MKFPAKFTTYSVFILAFLFLLSIPAMYGQAAEKQPMAEEVFKNITALKGLTASEFMETMSFYSASLGANCNYCHITASAGDWKLYADDTVKTKRTTRAMIAMVNAMNKQFFAGRKMLTCYSCHRGSDKPKVIPNLDDLYAEPPIEPNDDFLVSELKTPTADQVLDKFINALGGAQKLGAVNSYMGKGTYKGYDTPKVPFEIWAKTPNQRALLVQSPNGLASTIFDGRNGWTATPGTDRPIALQNAAEREGAALKLDAEMMFPANIKKSFATWKVGLPYFINDRDIVVLEGSSPGKSPARFYFDKETGLLVRYVRYYNSVAGLSPTRLEFDDYREVSGVKLPFKFNIIWLGGRGFLEVSDYQVNVPVDAAKFNKPADPAKK